MRFDALIFCNECDTETPEEAHKHIGCDTDGFGGHLKQCACCGDVYYASRNAVYANSPCCATCHSSYDKGWLFGSELKRYNKAMASNA